MPFEFCDVDDVTKARQRKQQRRLNELHFAWKTAPDLESKLFAALEYVTLFEEGYGTDDNDE